jgi:hypothetical protein
MTTPESPSATTTRPLDARRAQLRELGYTDSEISTIILKEVPPPPQPQAAAATATTAVTGGVTGQGVMSGVLNNLSVAVGLATGFLPSIATDITHLIGRDSSLPERSKGGVYLVAKLAFVAAIGFAIYQEWEQHIISQTKIAEQQAINLGEQAKYAAEREKAVAEKAKAESCAARMQNFGRFLVKEIPREWVLECMPANDSSREMASREMAKAGLDPEKSSYHDKSILAWHVKWLKVANPNLSDAELEQRAAVYMQRMKAVFPDKTEDEIAQIAKRGCLNNLKVPECER